MATFRYKVVKTIQVRQFEPLTIEAEYTADGVNSVASREKLAAAVEEFVAKHIQEQKAFYLNETTRNAEDAYNSLKAAARENRGIKK